MSEKGKKETMLEMFLYEAAQLLEDFEKILLESEKSKSFSQAAIDEIFRIMHTIKGSAAMMMYTEIAKVSHSLEDIFYYLRENKESPRDISRLIDIALVGVDFVKLEILKLENGDEADGDGAEVIKKIEAYLLEITNKEKTMPAARKAEKLELGLELENNSIKEEEGKTQRFTAILFFEEECQLENIRAYGVVNGLQDKVTELSYQPADILENEESSEIIRQAGFKLFFSTNKGESEIAEQLEKTLYLESLEIKELVEQTAEPEAREPEARESAERREQAKEQDSIKQEKQEGKDTSKAIRQQNIISVNVTKLDKLMDLVGEIVISEAMVTRNPDLAGLELDNFSKAARQLRKLNDELQDVVMSIRMMPIAATFHKMDRIVRDMGKNLGKEAQLVIIGEETEVDKNIIDNLSDPLMHLIRNAMDHGIETVAAREAQGKAAKGKIILEAKNAGGDVIISISDDGKGLDKEKILAKAKANGLVTKPDTELSNSEICSFILVPGFSTNEEITEYSGRGVGMDVVRKNIEKVGGTVYVDANVEQGTTIRIKIPLTLAIIDGMGIAVGSSTYTLPTVSIKESFRPKAEEVIIDTEGNEMLMIRGSCIPVVRLHKLFQTQTAVTELDQGIITVVENNTRSICIFADGLLGEQQVVVKPLPSYLARYKVKEKGVGGCTILGDGSISLILDVTGIINAVV